MPSIRIRRPATARARRRRAVALATAGLVAGILASAPVGAQPVVPGGSVLPAPVSPAAAPGQFNLLVVNGADPYLPAYVTIDGAMRERIAQRLPGRVNYFVETLDALRLQGPHDEGALVEMLRRKYERMRIDALVVVTTPALDLVRRHRAELWPGTPVIYHSVSPGVTGAASDLGLIGVPQVDPINETAELAIRLQPGLQRIVLVTGWASFDRVQASTFDPARLSRPAIPIERWQGLPLAELNARAARLPPDHAVVFASYFVDRDGAVFTPRDVVRGLAQASGAPVYVFYESQIGPGTVGGYVDRLAERGRRTADLLVATLLDRGRDALPTPAAAVPRCSVDARALARWGLSESRLPADCEVLFAEPSVWRTYRWQIVALVAVIAAQSATIVALLLQRRRRREAERTVAEQRDGLVRLTRLAAAGELTASIAHEINQPLGAIMNNADAADLLLERDGDHRDEVRRILADIRRDDRRASEVIGRLRRLFGRREVDEQPVEVDVAIAGIADVLQAEAIRRDVGLELTLSAGGATVSGDVVQLQQVVLNLALNACEAVRTHRPGAGLVRVATSASADSVTLTVSDNGPGVPAADVERIFQPLYTTRLDGTGLGLSIVRTIVGAHRGSITVTEARGGGAVFRCVLPRMAVVESPVSSAPPADGGADTLVPYRGATGQETPT